MNKSITLVEIISVVVIIIILIAALVPVMVSWRNEIREFADSAEDNSTEMILKIKNTDTGTLFFPLEKTLNSPPKAGS